MIKTVKTAQQAIIILGLAFSQNMHAQDEIIPLWPGKIPNVIKNVSYTEEPKIIDNILQTTSQVTEPTISVFLPKEVQPNGNAVLIMPGGGYRHLSMNKEGKKVAEWLNSLGITAFVLKYRLPNDAIMENKKIAPLQDAKQAMMVIRQYEKKWKIENGKLGIIGFSAGGHLAATLATQYDKNTGINSTETSTRPDFCMLIYPVISMKENITHKGSQTSLLGPSPSENDITAFSNEFNVKAETPITFIVHAGDDKAVVAENSIEYYKALKSKNIAAELHIYQKGGHGFGLEVTPGSRQWTNDCIDWLKKNNIIN